MHWQALSVLTIVSKLCLGAVLGDAHSIQVAFQSIEDTDKQPWDEPAGEDTTGHFIFHTLASLMQLAPNSQYSNGHSMVRATIPPGTTLYHGRGSSAIPVRDWIAFDPEHSYMFSASENGSLFTYQTTRELNLVYFDGASANKMFGVADAQDVLFLGKLRPDASFKDDWYRIQLGCEWGEKYGIDGFIRMEFNFEIMYCDFSQGLELVSSIVTVRDGGLSPPIPPFPKQPNDSIQADLPFARPSLDLDGIKTLLEEGDDDTDDKDKSKRPNLPRRKPASPPLGWKGSMDIGGSLEPVHSATWHNLYPGESRVRVDTSTLVSFFDPSYTSLIPDRRGRSRETFRLANVSEEDLSRARADFAETLRRGKGEGSGVDWVAVVKVITDRFADRLPFLRYLLHTTPAPTNPNSNITAHATLVRKHVAGSLLPYMPRDGIPDFHTWIARTASGCTVSLLPILSTKMTKQETVLHAAVEEVLHEICRVYTSIWSEAFDVELHVPSVASERLAQWKSAVDGLVEWLDWPMWNMCNPPCSALEYCVVPQRNSPFHRPGPGKKPNTDDDDPRCSLIDAAVGVDV